MGLGAAKTATLQQVAPGIAEALIATAIGLFAAIPAVIAYNRYSTEVDRLVNRYDTFAEEFSEHPAASGAQPAPAPSRRPSSWPGVARARSRSARSTSCR